MSFDLAAAGSIVPKAEFVDMSPGGGQEGGGAEAAAATGAGECQLQHDGHQGKRRKYSAQREAAAGHTLYQQFGPASSDGRVVLKIGCQPEAQHRARYQTEGSRGAIKDTTGNGHPTVSLRGYSKPAMLQIFIGSDTGRVVPHMFYQACRVTGKNSTPCTERKIDGTDVIEVPIDPQNDMTVVCDCVGILKERFADVEQRFPKQKTVKAKQKKSTKCRMVFRAVIETSNGREEILQTTSDIINCTQLPGTPEILKMSAKSSDVCGGGELWIIGKNFPKETKIWFTYALPGKQEPLWTREMEPDPEFFHQTHLITKIPPFYSLTIHEPHEVTVHVRCGDKRSDLQAFTYNPSQEQQQAYYDVVKHQQPPESGLPKGVAAPAVAINKQFAQTGTVSVITCANSSKVQPRPTILEPLHNHKTKKSRLDLRRQAGRRTRSVPRPILISEDTVFDVVERTCSRQKDEAAQTKFGFSQTPTWGFTVKEEAGGRGGGSLGAGALAMVKAEGIIQQHRRVSLTNNDDDSNSCNKFAAGGDSVIVDESSLPSSKAADVTSSLTTDFSSAFAIASSSSGGSSKIEVASQPAVTSMRAFHQHDILEKIPVAVQAVRHFSLEADQPVVTPEAVAGTAAAAATQRWNGEVAHMPSDQGNNEYCSPKGQEPPESSAAAATTTAATSDVPNVSLRRSEDDNKATISISLPPSILKDKKHFADVLQTINNTILKQPSSSGGEDAKEEQQQEQQGQNTELSPIQLETPAQSGGNSSSATYTQVGYSSQTTQQQQQQQQMNWKEMPAELSDWQTADTSTASKEAGTLSWDSGIVLSEGAPAKKETPMEWSQQEVGHSAAAAAKWPAAAADSQVIKPDDGLYPGTGSKVSIPEEGSFVVGKETQEIPARYETSLQDMLANNAEPYSSVIKEQETLFQSQPALVKEAEQASREFNDKLGVSQPDQPAAEQCINLYQINNGYHHMPPIEEKHLSAPTEPVTNPAEMETGSMLQTTQLAWMPAAKVKSDAVNKATLIGGQYVQEVKASMEWADSSNKNGGDQQQQPLKWAAGIQDVVLNVCPQDQKKETPMEWSSESTSGGQGAKWDSTGLGGLQASAEQYTATNGVKSGGEHGSYIVIPTSGQELAYRAGQQQQQGGEYVEKQQQSAQAGQYAMAPVPPTPIDAFLAVTSEQTAADGGAAKQQQIPDAMAKDKQQQQVFEPAKSDQVDGAMITYQEGSVPIKGNPLLSETSAVIGAQKTIEQVSLLGQHAMAGYDQSSTLLPNSPPPQSGDQTLLQTWSYAAMN